MVRSLGDDVWWFDDLRASNAYLLLDGDDPVLVDAGSPGDAEAIRDGVREAGFSLADVERVLLTHYDADHVGALAALTPRLNAPVYAGEADASLLSGRRRPPLVDRKGLFQRVAGLFLTLPDLPVRAVADGETVGGFTAYHTPGHTPGHTAFVADDGSVALLGDLVRESDGELVASPWYFSADTAAVRASVRRLAERAPEFDLACPGHGAPIHEGCRALRALEGSL